jgi:hypothetical protein
MNTSASVMTVVPFYGPLAIATFIFIVAGMVVITSYVVSDSLHQRRKSYFEIYIDFISKFHYNNHINKGL